MPMRRIVTHLVAAFGLLQPALADTFSITFETSENSAAAAGAEATNLYTDRGVRFPSRPTIEPDRANQVLQQGEAGGRPDPLRDRVNCAPLVIEFSAAMGVREARMRVINRHLRSYSIHAYAGSAEVDVDRFSTSPVSGPPYPPSLPYRDITLEAESGEGDITRIVANPPSDCFDLMVIDNLGLETARPVAPIDPIPESERENRYSVLAYEITQGVMSRLTRPEGARETTPDTRLMALPSKRLVFVEGRDTAARFFIGASERTEPDLNAQLRVTVGYRDGSRRNKTITENTEGGRAAPGPTTGGEDAQRRALVMRRARVDQSLDFVIPGRFLENARSMRLLLSTIPAGTPLARVQISFTGPYRMGLNVARVNGVGRDAVVGSAPPRSVTSLAQQFIEDLYPITGSIRLRESGVLAMNTGATGNCNAFLAALDAAIAGTAAAAPVPGVNYWTNMYIVQNPPGCGGLGWYNTPGAMTNTSFSTAAHEVSHNIGINHASNQHNESQGGTRGDWEAWPYAHGSIGTVDEAQSYNDGVFGLVMNPNSASVGLDMVDHWGVWGINAIPPCLAAASSVLFPLCSIVDTNITHDYMSYGPATPVSFWGQQNWISDINFYRIQRWMQDCTALDPPHRFQTGSTNNFADDSGECNSAGTPSSAGAFTAREAPLSKETLVFSGVIGADGQIDDFRVIRKITSTDSFDTPAGAYYLILRTDNGSIIRSIPFAARVAPGEGEMTRSFVVVAPYEPELERVEIQFNQETVFSQETTGATPAITLVRPKGGEAWRDGKRRIQWELQNAQGAETYIQYSPDKGKTWLPLGLIGDGQTSLDVDIEDLIPSREVLLYLSVSRGLRSSSATMKQTLSVGPDTARTRPQRDVDGVAFQEDCLAHDPDAMELKQMDGRWRIGQGSRWMLDFANKPDEAKVTLGLMKRFRFDEICYIGRPGPSMTYSKANGRVPGGSSQGLDCVAFDPSKLGVREEGGRWLLYSVRSRMADFPKEGEAQQALSVIKAYNLNRHCFVGRPDPSFEYWLSEGN